MLLKELKDKLNTIHTVEFTLPNGHNVPQHFHVTEVGEITRNFIDCGGKVRIEKKINIQLWCDQDYDHRLSSKKFIQIIEASENQLNIGNYDVEVEYQGKETIEKYGLSFKNNSFHLNSTLTACLDENACGIPKKKEKIKISVVTNTDNSCTPESGCC